jgi:hypothetical protein
MTARRRVDLQMAKVAAVNVALLTMILRPLEPMTEREFEALVIALAVVLAHAERRAGGRRD